MNTNKPKTNLHLIFYIFFQPNPHLKNGGFHFFKKIEPIFFRPLSPLITIILLYIGREDTTPGGVDQPGSGLTPN